MNVRMQKLMRRAMPFLAAGILLQTGGCDVGGIVGGLASTLAGAVLSDLIYGSFGLL